MHTASQSIVNERVSKKGDTALHSLGDGIAPIYGTIRVNPATPPTRDLRHIAHLFAIEDTKDHNTRKRSVYMFALGLEKVTWVCLEMGKALKLFSVPHPHRNISTALEQVTTMPGLSARQSTHDLS